MIRFCEKCNSNVDQETYVDEHQCQFWECPMEQNPVIDTADELHQILGEALALTNGDRA